MGFGLFAHGKGNVLPEFEADYKKYSLTYLLGQCPDFKNEKSALEKLAEDLSSRHGVKIKVLLTPKYHCELAGEGIEYAWGLAKKTFRRMPYKDKHGKAKFHGCARSSLYSVTVDHIRKYSARCRRYMLTYQLFDAQVPDDEAAKIGISYDVLESYVNTKMKAHRCTADQESRFIAEEWRKAQESRQIIG